MLVHLHLYRQLPLIGHDLLMSVRQSRNADLHLRSSGRSSLIVDILQNTSQKLFYLLYDKLRNNCNYSLLFRNALFDKRCGAIYDIIVQDVRAPRRKSAICASISVLRK